MKTRPNLTTIILLLLGSFSLTAAILEDWSLRHPTPYYADFANAAYGNGVYVIVGEGGMIATSSDLANWHTRHHPELLENVVFGDGQFVATGTTGAILTSADGTNWMAHASGISSSLSDVEYGNGLYVAAGESGVTAVSSNGMDWTISSAGAANFWYWGMAYGAGRFVAVATDADYNGPINIVTSSNGVDWAAATLPAGLPAYTELWGVGYGNGRFTAVGYWETEITPEDYIWGPLVLTSTDGLNWMRVDDPDLPMTDDQWVLWAVGHDGTQWVGVGQNGLVMTSPDGLDWTRLPTPLGNTPEFYGITFGPGDQMVCVGQVGTVYSTSDLSTWVDHWSGSRPNFVKMAFNGTQYLAGRDVGRVAISTDGSTWTDQFTAGLSGRITGAVHGMGRWLISSDSTSSSTHFPLSTSTNGTDWERPTTSSEFTDCRSVAFGNDLFVAIPKTGVNSLAYSTNGLDWSEVPHPWFTAVQGRNYLAFGGGHFLAWGHSDATVSVAVSTDGMNWQIHDTGSLPALVAGAHGNGRWVLVGNGGKVITSTDLEHWTEQIILFDGQTENLRGVAYGDGQWVIVGNNHSVWSSSDGLNWDQAFTTNLKGSSRYFADVVYDGTSFWTCGGGGVIYQSRTSTAVAPPTLTIRNTANPMQVELLIEGTTGQSWDLVLSPRLPAATWDYLRTITLTNHDHIELQDLADDTAESYYRLRSP